MLAMSLIRIFVCIYNICIMGTAIMIVAVTSLLGGFIVYKILDKFGL